MSIQPLKQKFNNACAISRIRLMRNKTLEAQNFKNKLDVLTTQMFGLSCDKLGVDVKAEYLKGKSLADILIDLQIDLL